MRRTDGASDTEDGAKEDHSALTLLGVDIGTTHVKACAYDEDGGFLGASRRSTPTRRLQGGGAEYDARAVECAVFEVIRQVAERFGPPRAIGVASMAESGFLLDGSGEPLAPAVAWFDGRTAPQTARWKERLGPLELFSRTGLHLAPRCSTCKLEWHRENTPEAWSKAGAWLGMAEYLVFRMTGEKSTDPSLASRTMLFMYRTRGVGREAVRPRGRSAGHAPSGLRGRRRSRQAPVLCGGRYAGPAGYPGRGVRP